MKLVLLTSMLAVMSMLFFSCATEPVEDNPLWGVWAHEDPEPDFVYNLIVTFNDDNSMSYELSKTDTQTKVTEIVEAFTGTYEVVNNQIRYKLLKEYDRNTKKLIGLSTPIEDYSDYSLKGDTLTFLRVDFKKTFLDK